LVCLDTSVLVALIRKDRSALEALQRVAERGGTVSTTPVNLCELYAGAQGAKDPRKEFSKVEEMTARLGLLEFGAGAARRYGVLVRSEPLRSEPIGDFDLIIAAIALHHGEVLATRDLKHFAKVPGLDVEMW
jgi:tRNA(fMet)-specific endonuclease VapC